MKGKGLQPRLFYPKNMSFTFKEEIKSITDKQKLREFSTIRLSCNKCYRNFSRWEKKPQLETRKLQMSQLSDQGKHKGRKSFIYKCNIKTRAV